MRIFGIDCGSQRTGYGVIDTDGRRHEAVAFGVIRTSPKDPFHERLRQIHSELDALVAEHRPDSIAIEEVFYASNVQTALKLAQVRGVTLLLAAQAELPVAEYSPLAIKGSVVGYGRAEKKQVQMMVASLLKLPEPVESDDAADALAVAICHGHCGVREAAAGAFRRA